MVKSHYIGSHVATGKDSHPKTSGLAEASPLFCKRYLQDDEIPRIVYSTDSETTPYDWGVFGPAK